MLIRRILTPVLAACLGLGLAACDDKKGAKDDAKADAKDAKTDDKKADAGDKDAKKAEDGKAEEGGW